MNVRKTKTMVVSKSENATTNIFVENEILEQLDTFKYLGQLITPDAKIWYKKKTSRYYKIKENELFRPH